MFKSSETWLGLVENYFSLCSSCFYFGGDSLMTSWFCLQQKNKDYEMFSVLFRAFRRLGRLEESKERRILVTTDKNELLIETSRWYNPTEPLKLSVAHTVTTIKWSSFTDHRPPPAGGAVPAGATHRYDVQGVVTHSADGRVAVMHQVDEVRRSLWCRE